MAEEKKEIVFNAFTQHWNSLTDRIISEIDVKSGDNVAHVHALWDTGASKTCISPSIVSQLRLKPIGKCTNYTASGPAEACTYLIDLLLPNHVRVQDVIVSDAQIGEHGFNVLIGMDIIVMGDFAVSNHNGKTTLSFRTPSKTKTDYVREIELQKLTGTHGKGKRKRRR